MDPLAVLKVNRRPALMLASKKASAGTSG